MCPCLPPLSRAILSCLKVKDQPLSTLFDFFRSEFKNEVEKPKTPDTAPAWNPTACFPPLKLCMKEKEFNLKLVQEKQKVTAILFLTLCVC